MLQKYEFTLADQVDAATKLVEAVEHVVAMENKLGHPRQLDPAGYAQGGKTGRLVNQ